jgi:hypothetical protein
MRKAIVYTRQSDGGVSVCTPTDDIMRWMGCGGLWSGEPRGFAETQIERMIADGRDQDAARRFANAVMFGGCTTAEAYEIIRDRDCAHVGRAIELWDVADIPHDRWFRDAWRRSHNGGPICIDLALARPIHFRKALDAVDAENKRRARDLMRFDRKVDADPDAIRRAVMAASDERELRAVWPKELH